MTASSASTDTSSSATGRLNIIRRVYVYLVALVSFIASLIATDRLIHVLAEIWLAPPDTYGSSFARDTIAASGGALLVSVPIFLIHWRLAVRKQQDQTDEYRSAWRKFFLYVASAVSTGYALVYGYNLLNGMGQLAFGISPARVEILPSRWLSLSLMILITLSLLRYFFTTLEQDGDYGTERGTTGTIRRIYMLLATVLGLILIILGAAQIVETPLRLLIEQPQLSIRPLRWQVLLADGIAKLLVGSLLWRITWTDWQRLSESHPSEGQTALRSAALYLSVMIAAIATLVPVAMSLRELLLALLPSDTTSLRQALDSLTQPISFLPIGLVAWFWHWRFLRQTMTKYGESPQTILIRRIYTYLVAAIGLALLWFGIAEVVQALLDWLFVANRTQTTETVITGSPWAEVLATGLSLVAVGAPVWSIHWRSVQSIATRDDESGLAERASAPRRAYLYGIALAGALLILYYLARVLYRLLLIALGEPDAVFFSAMTVEEMARAGIALIFWLIHLRAIREDGQLGAQLPESVSGSTPESAMTEDERKAATYAFEDRDALIARIVRLEKELAAAHSQIQRYEESLYDSDEPD